MTDECRFGIRLAGKNYQIYHKRSDQVLATAKTVDMALAVIVADLQRMMAYHYGDKDFNFVTAAAKTATRIIKEDGDYEHPC